MILAIQLRWDK